MGHWESQSGLPHGGWGGAVVVGAEQPPPCSFAAQGDSPRPPPTASRSLSHPLACCAGLGVRRGRGGSCKTVPEVGAKWEAESLSRRGRVFRSWGRPASRWAKARKVSSPAPSPLPLTARPRASLPLQDHPSVPQDTLSLCTTPSHLFFVTVHLPLGALHPLTPLERPSVH